MATSIQIKRSANVSAPLSTDLLEGELAYSYDKSNDGAGAKLYIEALDSGNNEVVHAIGGKFYTDAIDGATANNTASKIVKRDASGNFSANKVTADLYGNANTATQLATTRYINLTGDASGTAAFDGTGNADISVTVNANGIALGTDTTGDYVANVLAGTGIAVTGQGGEGATPTVALATSGVTANTYGGTSAIPVITVDQYGRITSAANTAITVASTAFTTVAVSGQSDVVADSATDTLTLAGGTGVTITTDAGSDTVTFTNSGVTSLATGGYGLTVSGATGGITVTNTGVTRLIAGTGVSVDQNNGNVTVTNSGVTSIAGTTNQITASASTGGVTLSLPTTLTAPGDLTITGNLYVQGTAVTLDTASITLEDPLVKFGNANPTDSIDIGFYGEYTSSGTKYTGLYRDHTDGKFRLFSDLASDPVTNAISSGSITVATLVANITGGTVSGLSANIAVSDGGTGRGTLTTNGVIYGQGTSAVGIATGSNGQVLQLNDSGVPTFAGIDGGSY